VAFAHVKLESFVKNRTLFLSWPLHDIPITNIVLRIAYTRVVGEGRISRNSRAIMCFNSVGIAVGCVAIIG